MYIRPSAAEGVAELHFDDDRQAHDFALAAFPFFSRRGLVARQITHLSRLEGNEPIMFVDVAHFPDMQERLEFQVRLCDRRSSPQSSRELLTMQQQVQDFAEYPELSTIPSTLTFSIPHSMGPHNFGGPKP